jgi:hypothetical protein
VVRGWQAIFDHGMLWPDEIYQSLEQAHRLVFKVGFIPWEFRDGARSWLFPALLALPLKLADMMGVINSGVEVVVVARTLMLALSVWSTACAMRIAEKLSGESAAIIAGSASVLLPTMAVFGARTMSEIAAAPLITCSAYLLLSPQKSHRAAWAGGLMGLSAFFRYQNALLALIFVIALVRRSTWRSATAYIVVGLMVAMAGGLIDRVIWGEWFHSLIVYLKFNVIEGKASSFGTAPALFYFKYLWASCHWPILIFAAGILVIAREAWLFVFAVVLFLCVHSLIPHKELRFIVPILPLAVALGAAGIGKALALVLQRRQWIGAWSVALICSVVWVHQLRKLTLEDIGYGGPGVPVFGRNERYNRALWEVGKQPDACGLAIIGSSIYYLGGYAYLHRNIPVYTELTAKEMSFINYVIAPVAATTLPGVYQEVSRWIDAEGKEVRVMRRDGSCAAGAKSTFNL